MYEKLRAQEQRVRHADSREAPLFKKGDLVWLHSKRVAKNKSRKVATESLLGHTKYWT